MSDAISGASPASPPVAVAATGAANIASVLSALARAGARPFLTTSPEELRNAPFAVLPGVGAFGPAMERLRASGLDRALRERVRSGRPTLGVCLGMQLFCQGSEEARGIEGIGVVPGIVKRFEVDLPLPQLGWNLIADATAAADEAPIAAVAPSPERPLVVPGWAYFANSYRLTSLPPGFRAWTARYGETFVAALQGKAPGTRGLLLCQFHPELSGPWGLDVYRRWLGVPALGAAPRTTAGRGPSNGVASDDSTAIRIIPCLDLKNGRVVKGKRFEELKDAGDPLELALRYEAEGADEIALLDITATVEGRAMSLAVLRRLRERIGIPLAMGGGIRDEEGAAAAVEAGADRVSVNSAAVADPELIDRLAARFGVQCVVVAIDAARVERSEGGGKPAWRVFVEAGRRRVELDPVAWSAECARRGAGEILLTSIDRDGTGEGYDLELVEAVAEASGLPVIASGGVAGGAEGLRHFAGAAGAGARGLLAAGAFHRGELKIADVKTYLAERNIGVRR